MMELLDRSAMEDAPSAATTLHCQRGIEGGRLIEVLDESHAAALVAAPHIVEGAAQSHAAVMDHRHVVGHPLHLVEQM